MTILWQDGFDLYNNNSDFPLNYLTTGSGSVAATGGRFGGPCFQTSRGQPGIWRNVGVQTELWVSFAIYIFETQSQDYSVITFGTDYYSNNGVENVVTYNASSGSWKLWAGYVSTLFGTAYKPVGFGWHWVEARLKRDASAGEFELWVDDVQLLNLTGLNTEYRGSTYNMIYAGIGDTYGGNTGNFYADDLFIYTPGSRLGDSRIETLLPNSDVGPNDGTPSTGTSHYSVVGEAQWNTTDYLTMPNTSGDKEVFGHGSILSAPPVVHSVKVSLVSQKSDAGSYLLEPIVLSSGTESDGSSQQLNTTWGTQNAIWETDPHTSAAWTYSAANATAFGFKVA